MSQLELFDLAVPVLDLRSLERLNKLRLGGSDSLPIEMLLPPSILHFVCNKKLAASSWRQVASCRKLSRFACALWDTPTIRPTAFPRLYHLWLRISIVAGVSAGEWAADLAAQSERADLTCHAQHCSARLAEVQLERLRVQGESSSDLYGSLSVLSVEALQVHGSHLLLPSSLLHGRLRFVPSVSKLVLDASECAELQHVRADVPRQCNLQILQPHGLGFAQRLCMCDGAPEYLTIELNRKRRRV